MTPEQHEIERRRAWVSIYKLYLPTMPDGDAAGAADRSMAEYDRRFRAPEPDLDATLEQEAKEFGAVPDTDTLNDKIDGLSSDLDGALDQLASLISGKVTTDQAREWMGLNYPRHRATLSLTTPTEPDWIDHTPGDPCPCEPGMRVKVRLRDGETGDGTAAEYLWGKMTDRGAEVIQWKPAQ